MKPGRNLYYTVRNSFRRVDISPQPHLDEIAESFGGYLATDYSSGLKSF